MRIVDRSGLTYAFLAGDAGLGGPAATFVVKATLVPVAGGVARLADEQEFPAGDVPFEDEPDLCRYPSDMVPYKPRAEAFLLGTCHAPGGSATACSVGFGIGTSWLKRLQVSGPQRLRSRLLLMEELGTAAPFEKIELSYRNAFGGPGYAKNPFGRGIAVDDDPREGRGRTMPAILDPRRPSVHVPDQPDPAGFGAIPMKWPQRMSKAGTYDARWQRTRWPWFPDDFDWTFWNAAPPDQQFASYFRGDEEILFENVHAIATFRTRLPGLRPRLFAMRADGRFEDVPLVLDTIVADMDRERISLVWRGRTRVTDLKLREIAGLVLGRETLAAPAPPESEYRAAWDAPAEEIEPGDPAAPHDLDDGWVAELEREAAALEVEIADAKALVEKHQADNLALAKDAGIDTSSIGQGGLPADDELARILASSQETLAALAKEHPELVPLLGAVADLRGPEITEPDLPELPADEDDVPAEPEPWTRERVAAHAAAGGTFAGENLAGLDLSGLRFAGLDLSGADLSGAGLADADLAGAIGRGTLFLEADAPRSRWIGADLSGADFSRANVEGGVFRETKLADTSFFGARAARADLSQADVTGLRGSEGADFSGVNLARARGTGPNWETSNLAGADLERACLPQANFEAADLTGARLFGADLRGARFDEAKLGGAVLVRANFFRASFEGADLRRADGRLANFFEAEFWNAKDEGALLEGANLGRTKKA